MKCFAKRQSAQLQRIAQSSRVSERQRLFTSSDLPTVVKEQPNKFEFRRLLFLFIFLKAYGGKKPAAFYCVTDRSVSLVMLNLCALNIVR